MRGTTLSGKDTFISKHFKDGSAIFSSDHFRKMLCGDVHVQQFNNKVFHMMHEIIEFRIANRVDYTVYNATNLKIKDASTIIELAKKYQCPVTVISIQPPDVETLHKRNKKRNMEEGFLIPDNVIEKHYDRYSNCMKAFEDEAYNNHLVKLIEIDQDYEVVREI
jgi:predicted kinase